MPQIFHRSTNTLSRVHRSTNTLSRATIFGAVFVIAALSWVAMEIQRSPYVTYAGVRKPQPVPFSHQHHVAGLGIDCRYCHTSVETSSFAGIPPTKTCMNCHSQVWTNAELLEPVRASYRTGQSQMPLMYQQESLQMEWCLNCHRAPEKNLRPREQVFNMRYQQPTSASPVVVDGRSYTDQIELGLALVRKYNVRSVKDITSCSTCHR